MSLGPLHDQATFDVVFDKAKSFGIILQRLRLVMTGAKGEMAPVPATELE